MSSPAHRARRQIPRIEALEPRTLFATEQILIGEGAAKAVTWTDPNGTQGSMFITGPGAASVMFNGDNLGMSPSPRGVVVTGSNVTLRSIGVNGSTTSSALNITARGGTKALTCGAIDVSGALAALRAPGVTITDNLTTSSWVHQLQLAGAQGGTISIGPSRGGGGTLVATLGNVSGESLSSAIRINVLHADQWTGSAQTVSAPQIVNLQVKGTFAPGIMVLGAPAGALALSKFSAGAISGGTWNVTGNTGTVLAGSIAPGWTPTFNGTVNNLQVAHDASMMLTAGAIHSISIRGTLSNSTLALINPLSAGGSNFNNLNVGDGIVGTTIRSGGTLGSINAGRMQDSQVYAGLNLPMGQTLPAHAGDFASVAAIKAVNLHKGASASFVNSDIGAYSLGTMNLGEVQMANGGTAFGLGAHSIQSLSLTDQTTGKSVHASKLASSAAFSTLLASKGISPQDFVVQLV